MPVEKQIQFTGDASSLRSELARIDADFDRFSARLKSIQEDAVSARGITRDRDLSDLEGLSRRFEQLRDESRALSAIDIPSQQAEGIAKPSEALVIEQDDTVSQASTSEIAVLAPQTEGSLISSPDITNKGITDPDTPLENIEDILRNFTDDFLREFRRSNEYERDYDTEREIHPLTPVSAEAIKKEEEEEQERVFDFAGLLSTPKSLIAAGRSGSIEYAGEVAGGIAGSAFSRMGSAGISALITSGIIGIIAKLFSDSGVLHEANYQYRAITGLGKGYDPREEAKEIIESGNYGLTTDAYLKKATHLRKHLGFAAGDMSLYGGVREAELTYGVSEGALTSALDVGEFMKKMPDPSGIIGGLSVVTKQFKDGHEKIGDYLKTYTSVAKSQAHRTSVVASYERLLGLIGLGTALGSKFADERQAHVFAGMDAAIAKPANQYVRAENLRDLSRILGTTNYVDLLKAEEKGLAQPAILSEILKDTEGVDRNTAIIGLMKRLGLGASAAEKLFDKYKGKYEPLMKYLKALDAPDKELGKILGIEGASIEVDKDRIHSSVDITNKMMDTYKNILAGIGRLIMKLDDIFSDKAPKYTFRGPGDPFSNLIASWIKSQFFNNTDTTNMNDKKGATVNKKADYTVYE